MDNEDAAGCISKEENDFHKEGDDILNTEQILGINLRGIVCQDSKYSKSPLV